MSTSDSAPLVAMTLDAVIVAVTGGQPRLLVVHQDGEPSALPSGPLDVAGDTTLELGVRRLLTEQTGVDVGYVEQLYTFGDYGRRRDDGGHRQVSVGYLALVRETEPPKNAGWINVHELMPWEDHRTGEPELLDASIRPRLHAWAEDDRGRLDRISMTFGSPWDGIRVLERYELLYAAGLVAERARDENDELDGRDDATPQRTDGEPAGLANEATSDTDTGGTATTVGTALRHDHRRIAATAIGRLRGKLTYRPLVFELLPERFTLLELQQTVEALAGLTLHKQNFRRMVDRSGLVEGTGEAAPSPRGRPAELFRYRKQVLLERPRPGVLHPYR